MNKPDIDIFMGERIVDRVDDTTVYVCEVLHWVSVLIDTVKIVFLYRARLLTIRLLEHGILL